MILGRQAFAKINLDLRITGCRVDGYHDLDTVFQTISICDTLRVESTADHEPFTLYCDDAHVPTDQRNLVWKAAASLWRTAGRDGEPKGARITLSKRIPVQGGLGGGSSDAAVALIALSEVWAIPIRALDWRRLTSDLGADVTFFGTGGTMRGTRRGDVLEGWPDLPPVEVVVAVPSFGVASARAYAWHDADGIAPSESPARAAPVDWTAWLRRCRNDLEEPVFARHHLLKELKLTLVETGAVLALMSGSGSSVFGLFEDGRRADLAVRGLGVAGVEILRARPVSRTEYVRRSLGESSAVGLPPASAIV
jgi:4-diphosphocytidyl-2-C-methyl-D-erythritol kinase